MLTKLKIFSICTLPKVHITANLPIYTRVDGSSKLYNDLYIYVVPAPMYTCTVVHTQQVAK